MHMRVCSCTLGKIMPIHCIWTICAVQQAQSPSPAPGPAPDASGSLAKRLMLSCSPCYQKKTVQQQGDKIFSDGGEIGSNSAFCADFSRKQKSPPSKKYFVQTVMILSDRRFTTPIVCEVPDSLQFCCTPRREPLPAHLLDRLENYTCKDTPHIQNHTCACPPSYGKIGLAVPIALLRSSNS